MKLTGLAAGPATYLGRSAREWGEYVDNETRTAIALSVVVYACVIGVNFEPSVHAKQVEAFGAVPLGLPVRAVVVLAESILFVPMPWCFWHAMRIAYQAAHDGCRFGLGYL